jgi:hypothetical protein
MITIQRDPRQQHSPDRERERNPREPGKDPNKEKSPYQK